MEPKLKKLESPNQCLSLTLVLLLGFASFSCHLHSHFGRWNSKRGRGM